MRAAVVTFALGLALAAAPAPAHAEGRNAGLFSGSQGYQGGCTPASCDTYFSLVVPWGGGDGAGLLRCVLAGEVTYDGTTEQGTVPGTCTEVTAAGEHVYASGELTYSKSLIGFSGHVVASDGAVAGSRAAGLSGWWAPVSDLTVRLAGTATVYTL